tara:strand:+ start:3260 stop:3709 length:450 start_codon:yes stop_codon:yes gene_type:complete
MKPIIDNKKNKNDLKNMSYNTRLICTYKNFDTDYYCNLCYQIQLLQVFDMLKYDEFILNNNIEICYNILKTNTEIREIIDIMAQKNAYFMFIQTMSDDMREMVVFQLFFSYDYFDDFHKCLAKYIIYHTQNQDSNALFFQEFKEIVVKN